MRLADRALEEVRLAEKVGDEARAGPLVQLPRAAGLDQLAVIEDGDAVGQRERFLLVVRHIDEGAPDAAMQRLQFLLQFRAQLLVECGERFIQQQQVGIEDQRHALLLPARQLLRQAFGEGGQLHQVERRPHLRVTVGSRQPAHAQREGDVLRDRHVREQRIALEHHAEVALLRRQRGDVPPVEQHRTLAWRDEAGHRHQDRRLPRSGRAEQRQELPLPHFQRHVIDRDETSIAPRQPAQAERMAGGRAHDL